MWEDFVVQSFEVVQLHQPRRLKGSHSLTDFGVVEVNRVVEYECSSFLVEMGRIIFNFLLQIWVARDGMSLSLGLVP